VEKTNVGGVVSLTRKRIVPIDHMLELPTLISTSHVPIVIHMGMITKRKLEKNNYHLQLFSSCKKHLLLKIAYGNIQLAFLEINN